MLSTEAMAATVAEMASTRMVRFKPGEKQVMALRDALFSDTGRDKDVRVPCCCLRRLCFPRYPVKGQLQFLSIMRFQTLVSSAWQPIVNRNRIQIA